MLYRTHVLGGISAGIVVNHMLISHVHMAQPGSSVIMSSTFIAGSVLGSIFCDIDKPNSFIGRRFKFISIPTNAIFGHRGMTHVPLVAVLIECILFAISKAHLIGISQILFNYMILGFGVGMLIGHIFLDSLTKMGVPLLYPFSKKDYSFLPVTVGGFGEKVVAGLIVVGTVLFVLHNHTIL